MKMMIKKILVAALILVIAVSLFGCGDNDGKKYNESGLNFVLPDYMKELEVSASYADVAYGTLDDRSLEFTVYFYSASELLSELLMDRDSTVKQYADWFVEMNGYENVSERYDEEGKKITLRYVYESGSDSYFFYDYILRNEYMLYHITMSCNPEDRATYEPLFDEWAAKITLDY
jgi:hypothetical protein